MRLIVCGRMKFSKPVAVGADHGFFENSAKALREQCADEEFPTC
jgi:hypothetical protein